MVSLFSIIEARTLERFTPQWNYQYTRMTRASRGHKRANLSHEPLRAAGQAGTATAIKVLNLRAEVASQD